MSSAASKVASSQFDECQKQIEDALSLMQNVKISNEEIVKFHKGMHEQDVRHQDAMEEIRAMQFTLYEKNVYEDMENEITRQAEAQIDPIIQEQVEAELRRLIPDDQQQKLADIKKEMQTVTIGLHNSESRQANSFLQHESMNKKLNTIKMSNGDVSEHFPKTLKELFALDEENTGKLTLLAADYPDYRPEGSTVARLNQFIQFCGVRYQLVSVSCIMSGSR